ncbi:MAG: hypothetical protein IH582_12695 [Afipia sp.]|nr:hypothetical protein [Afipia sp.]
MAAFQVRIAYLTPLKRSRHYFHQLVLASDQQSALAEGRALLKKRSPQARIVHAAANLRPDSKDAEAAIQAGWRYRDGWWSRPIRAGDDLAAIAVPINSLAASISIVTPHEWPHDGATLG